MRWASSDVFRRRWTTRAQGNIVDATAFVVPAWTGRAVSRGLRVAVNLEQNAMVPPLPIMIGYALWFIFVIAWNVTARPAPTIATPGARRERLYDLVISLGLIMIVGAPSLLVRRGFQIWTNPPLLAWGMLLVVAAGI